MNYHVKALYSDNSSEIIASFNNAKEARSYIDLKERISLNANSHTSYTLQEEY